MAPQRAPRMTATTVQVLQSFLDAPTTTRYGRQLMSLTGLPSGTVFPILARFEGLGWLESGWEDVDPTVVGRPPRRFYRLTPIGLESAVDALARVASERQARLGSVRPVEGIA